MITNFNNATIKNSMKNNNKGFTLIELILVTIILGILAAVATPRVLGVLTKVEQSNEEAVITNLRAGCEAFAHDMLIEKGRKSYPLNPFDAVEVSNFVSWQYFLDNHESKDDIWTITPIGTSWWQGFERVIIHKRADETYWDYPYTSSDRFTEQGDDRGIIGERRLGLNAMEDVRLFDNLPD